MRTFLFPNFLLYRWLCISLLVAGDAKPISSQVLNTLYAVPTEKRLDLGIRLLLDSVSTYDTTTSFRLLDAFIQYTSSRKDVQLKATAYAFKAIHLEYRIEKGYERSIPYFRRAVSLLEDTDFELEKAYFTNRLGYALCSKHEYQEGLAFLLKSDYMMKHIGYERIKGVEYSLYRIARVYFDFEDYENAIRHLETAFSHTQKEDLLHSMNNLMAISYAELKNTEKSLFYIQQALKAAININDTFGVASALTNIGMMYAELEDYTKGRYFLDSAYALNVKRKYWRNAASALLGLAEVNIAEKKYAKAQQNLSQAHHFITTNNINELVGWASYYEIAADLYRKEKKFELASLYLDSLLHTEDHMKQKRDMRLLSNLSIQLANGKHQADLDLLEKEKKLQRMSRNSIVVGSILAIVLLIGLWYSSIVKRKVDQRSFLAEQKKAKEALTEFARRLRDKNELIENLKQQLHPLEQKNGATDEVNNELMQRLDRFIILTEENWLEFKKLFDNVYPNFLRDIPLKFPELTLSEIRLLALIKLNLSVTEMANTLGILPQSVRKTRQRLMKKLGLTYHKDLPQFVESLQ